ncbi:MAG: amino acid--tRNA ligase-related protein, partial [Pseudomonadota bacterium]|nr:amino acid--tRNA ligase-related protein [Pseudomonadota bacterium]
PTVAARFELVIDGVEIANGYWELQDPAEHYSRFAEDRRVRKARGLPDVEPDTEFLQALEQGLPQCAGVALGVDRLLMLSRRAVRLEPLVPTMDS